MSLPVMSQQTLQALGQGEGQGWGPFHPPFLTRRLVGKGGSARPTVRPRPHMVSSLLVAGGVSTLFACYEKCDTRTGELMADRRL